MSEPELALVEAVRPALEAIADPDKAGPMAAYMKHKGAYLGVQKPARAAAQRALFKAHPLEDAPAFLGAVAAIWDRAEYREERYVALDLLALQRYRRFLDPAALGLIERLIVEGAWWDLVDACSGPLGVVVRAAPGPMKAEMRRWAADRDLWKRRSAMIFQLKYKAETDFELLCTNILTALEAPGLDSPLADKDQRFYIAKAAGWSLRQYARTAPEAVLDWVRAHEARLPTLTRREALKHFDLC